MCAHFAFVTLPASGHVNPTLPLVEELVRRGHRITYSGGSEHATAIRAAGATPVSLGSGPVRPSISPGGPTADDVAAMLIGGLDATRRAVSSLERVFRADPPDVLCFDALTPYGPMLARRLGVRAAATVPTFASNERFDPMSSLILSGFDESHPRYAEYAAGRDELAAEFGVPVEAMTHGSKFAELSLVFIPREFQIEGDSFGEEFRFIGPSFRSRAEHEQWHPPAGAQRVLFISLGTVVNDRPDFFSLCAKAFGDTGWHVALAVGDRADLALLGELPANFEVRPYFPQHAVLDHATVFLSHTGMNSTMEALLSEVPVVSFPQTPEQAANGRRVQELGLGRMLGAVEDPARLRQIVDEVAADPAVRAALAAMADRLRAAGGARAGADALEGLLRP